MTRLEMDPTQLGNLEVGWWIAHNDKDKEMMAKLLVEQNMALYGFSKDEAEAALQPLTKGVQYHDLRKWDEAINAVGQYYEKVKAKTGLSFNPPQVAKLEVG